MSGYKITPAGSSAPEKSNNATTERRRQPRETPQKDGLVIQWAGVTSDQFRVVKPGEVRRSNPE
jgi:hypothetical protein